MNAASANHFRKRSNNEEYENLPIILEGNTLRTRHELIAQWHVEEELGRSARQRLSSILKTIEIDDPLERSVLIALLGRKNIVRRYFSHLEGHDFEAIVRKAAEHQISQRLAMMADGWIRSFEGEFEEARRIFRSVLEEHPNFLPAILEAGKTEFILDNIPEAERLLLRLLVLDPQNLHARTELAKVYQVQKRYDEAEKVLRQSLAIDPKQLHPRTELAKVYQVQRRYDEAEKVLKESLAIDPKQLHPRTELAKVYQTQKRYDEAKRILDECIVFSPHDLNSRTELAKIYHIQKKYDDAERVLKECITLSPGDLNSRTELAKVYQVQKKYDRAVTTLEDLLKLESQSLFARTELGKIFRAQKRYGEAERVLKECIEISPDDLNSRTELAKVYQVQRRYDEAERVLRESLDIDPKQLHPRTELARVYIGQGLFRKARAEVVGFIRDHKPSDYETIAHMMLAYLNACFRMRRYQDGINFIDSLGCQFVSAELAEEYGRLLRAYDLPSAVTFFQTTSRLFKNSGRLLSEAAVCFKLARRGDAENILVTAICLQPDKKIKYQEIYNNPPVSRRIEFGEKDCTGRIISIDYERTAGAIETGSATYSFRWDTRFDPLFKNLEINDEVFFDLTGRGYAVNVEPAF